MHWIFIEEIQTETSSLMENWKIRRIPQCQEEKDWIAASRIETCILMPNCNSYTHLLGTDVDHYGPG